MQDMKFHSTEVRQLALCALERGESRRSVAAMFAMPLSTLDRWWGEFRHLGKRAPLPRGHRRAAFSGADLARLESQLRACPDATLEQQAANWRQTTGQQASRASLHRALKRLGPPGPNGPMGWTRKKRVCAPASATKQHVQLGGKT